MKTPLDRENGIHVYGIILLDFDFRNNAVHKRYHWF